MNINGLEIYPGANLRDASLYGANLRGANLRGADLCGANLYGADLRGANLRGADLRGADLRVADLRDASLRDASLYGADLHSADLHSADLRGADLRIADLRDADLHSADLRGAIGDGDTVKSAQVGSWQATWYGSILSIGCQCHDVSKWRQIQQSDELLKEMDYRAPAEAAKYLEHILALVEADLGSREAEEVE